MMKKVFKDAWFQMFAGIGVAAYLVSLLGSASTRSDSAPSASPDVPAAAAAPAAPAAASPITPTAAPSSELATFNPPPAAAAPAVPAAAAPAAPAAAAPPVAPPPSSPPPKMTLTGSGVGNAQGIPGGAGGGMGGLAGLLNSMIGGGAPQAQVSMTPQAPVIPYSRVTPSRSGVFTVGPAGTPGTDTASLRDAVFSAGNGDLIVVKPGSYIGNLEVMNKSVRIRGAGAAITDVSVLYDGRGPAISVRNGELDLENLTVGHAAGNDPDILEPTGVVYAIGSALSMRRVNLNSLDYRAPSLLAELGEKPTRITVSDSTMQDMAVRGAVKAKLTRVSFVNFTRNPVAAWIDAYVELIECRFAANKEPVISAYEGARVVVTGEQKPRISAERGGETAAIEESFGSKKRAATRASGFAKDIFRRGRRPGSLP